MGIVRPEHVSAKRDGKDRTVAQWIKMHYNAYPIALDTAHSIWTHRHAIAKRNGAVTIVQKVRAKTTIINPRHIDDNDDDDD